jgi:endoglucanase
MALCGVSLRRRGYSQTQMRGNRAADLLGVIACAIVVCGTQAGVASGGSQGVARNTQIAHGTAAGVYSSDPLAGWTMFPADNTPAGVDVARFRARGLRRDAQLMERISREPVATWLTADTSHVRRQVTALTADASRHRAAAVIVAYAVPGRNCSEGVDTSARTYLRWIGEIAAGIARRDTIVILEPDAIPFAIAGCPIHIGLLARAVKELAGAAGARVYIDAGNPSWVTPATLLAAPLRAADIHQAAGFSLNVANFQTNTANIAYGHELSRLLGDAHFVIDTSRNGNGPELGTDGVPIICNPVGRALGSPPTTNTGVPGLDAYLWVKPPGSSDGSCRPGAPRPSEWWPQYALELAANAPSDAFG